MTDNYLMKYLGQDSSTQVRLICCGEAGVRMARGNRDDDFSVCNLGVPKNDCRKKRKCPIMRNVRRLSTRDTKDEVPLSATEGHCFFCNTNIFPLC